ncbi:Late embryogenesis abundant protein [Geopseudomonas sagittaria]|uniref:Late embryogenesis abundant protein n=1 Tax=Geopseudomonas sagittaria TaxID=1135990 RepID=A0A1I5UYY2_9GAMM|nr:LEA type 2 family protein [Pseudomonas sagittaria]MCM2331200.1 LEA type 2 family protein [Pseudomonas sagittaria]SFQ00257.1 Late embryogenesis abundant protein [Pseudomonas sagittaria]
MSSLVAPPVVRAVRFLLAALLVLSLSACAALGVRDPLNIQVVGIEPLPGEGLEMRFAVKLRLQNPNTTPIDYDGIALELKVNDRSLARGVSAQSGSVPRFGETLLVVPVSISAFAAVRQALGLAENARLDSLPYVLRGKFGGGLLGGRRFSDAGTLDLSAVGKARR